MQKAKKNEKKFGKVKKSLYLCIGLGIIARLNKNLHKQKNNFMYKFKSRAKSAEQVNLAFGWISQNIASNPINNSSFQSTGDQADADRFWLETKDMECVQYQVFFCVDYDPHRKCQV